MRLFLSKEPNLDGLIPPPVGEVTSETLQEDRASQASLEALSHEFSTVSTENK